MNSICGFRFQRVFLRAAAVLAALPASGADLTPLEIHGAVSATAGYSDRYNYLGETKDRFEVFDTEVTVNGTHRFGNGVRFGAQLYAYKLDDYRDLTLDFASFDYSFNEFFGVRVGRSKQAVGLYGDVQDIDMIRPFAFLPLNAYPKAMRSYAASYDGMAVYGNVPMNTAGSLDYHVYGGWVPKYRANDPWLQIMNDAAAVRVTDVNNPGRVFAGSLYWNTPVSGLKVGASGSRTIGGHLSGFVRSGPDLALAAGDIRVYPAALPPGVWDYMIAGHPGRTDMERVTQVAYSAEYTVGSWLFAAEHTILMVNASNTVPVLDKVAYSNRSDDTYVMATWQALPKVQLAAYYEEGYANSHDRKGHAFLVMPQHRAWTKDKCVAACYSVASWWLVKAEAHFVDGTALLTGALNGDALRWSRDWNFLVLKTTISF